MFWDFLLALYCIGCLIAFGIANGHLWHVISELAKHREHNLMRIGMRLSWRTLLPKELTPAYFRMRAGIVLKVAAAHEGSLP